MNARIYTVTDKTTGQQQLVKAASQAQAVRHVAADRLTCAVATGIQIAELMQAGAVLVDATAGTTEPEPAHEEPSGGLPEPQGLLGDADAAADLAGQPRPAETNTF